MSGWRAVVFDLDDTLYPEREYVLSGFDAAATWVELVFGVPAAEARSELRGLFDAGVRGDTFDRWLVSRGLPRIHVTELVRAYREHHPRLAPFPEVPALLGRLSSRLPLGLVSDGYLDVQRAKLTALGLASYFKAIVFSDEMGRDAWKPSTRPFRRVLDILGVEPEDAVYVADNCSKDFIGARATGMATIWARHSNGDYALREPASTGHAADWTIASLRDLEALLQ